MTGNKFLPWLNRNAKRYADGSGVCEIAPGVFVGWWSGHSLLTEESGGRAAVFPSVDAVNEALLANDQGPLAPKSRPRTRADHDVAMEGIVANLPESFRRLVYKRSWDEGHSAGYGEVENIAHDLAGDIEEALADYIKALKGK